MSFDPQPNLAPHTAPRRPPTRLGLVTRRFLRHRLAAAGLLVLFCLFASAVFAPWLSAYPPDHVNLLHVLAPPSLAHPLGTDAAGRDVFTRLLFAGRVSLSIGLAVAIAASCLGTLVGAVAGYVGGHVDALLMRFVDMMLSIPFLFFVLLFDTIFRPGVPILIGVIALFSWMGLARIVRAEFLTLKTRDYVEAARSEGASDTRIVLRHLLPGAASSIIVYATLSVATAIYIESVLSFLGFGVSPPTASWGSMLNTAQQYLWTQPWLAIYPGLMILITGLSVNAVGDGLRDALDPSTW